MNDWTYGYVADVGYTFGYYPELNPLRAKLAFLNSGVAFPDIRNACELGFGQGVSVTMHAASSDCHWFGTDFNPAQASFAKEIASVSGANCHLSDQSFKEFCQRDDLPSFDFIGMHGIWSWISDENRSVIVDFIRRKLNVGGVLYISYNTQPGWAQMVPVRHLLTEHAEVMAAPGRGIVSRIDAALDFADKLFALNPAFARANPPVLDRLKQIRSQNRHYLAHEYFNRDWEPMHFADVANWQEPARICYACSANLLDHVRAFNISNDQAAFLAEIPDQNFRETVRDFLVNQQFRRDYWVKGLRRTSVGEQIENIKKVRVILLTPASDVSMKVNSHLGDASMNEEIYRPLIEDLAGHAPVPIETLFERAKARGGNSAQVVQGLLILIGRGDVILAQDEEVINSAKIYTDRLNRTLMDRSRWNPEVSYFASPVAGGAVPVSRTEQLFIYSLLSGKSKPELWAADAWEIISSMGQRLVKDGKPLDTSADNIAELTAQANSFSSTRLPVLRSLQVF